MVAGIDSTVKVTAGKVDSVAKTADNATITLTGGTFEVEPAADKETAKAGETVTITADSKAGYTFKNWTSDDVTVANATQKITTFVMPEKAVTVTANYSRKSSGGSSGGGGAVVTPKPSVTVDKTDDKTDDKTTITTQTGAVVESTQANTEVTVSEAEYATVNKVIRAVQTNDNLNVIGGTNSAINVTAKNEVSGAEVNKFTQPMSVKVPVSNWAINNVEDTSKLTLAKVVTNEDGTTELIYMGGSYDAVTGSFTAKVDEAGDYILVEKTDLVKIELNINNTVVKENDKQQFLDVAPEINGDNRTMLPLRYIGEALGCNVNWNEATRTITIQKDDVVMNLTIDQTIDGFDTAATIKNGRTLVPVRYISEMLGANVIWDPVDQQIVIVK